MTEPTQDSATDVSTQADTSRDARDSDQPTRGREPTADRGGSDTRRRFLATVSAASAVLLAGCQGGGDSTDEPETDTPEPTATETSTDVVTSAPTETATRTETSADTATATPEPPAGVRLPAAALTEFQLAAVGFETVTLDDEGGS
jgi:hypothetical protein